MGADRCGQEPYIIVLLAQFLQDRTEIASAPIDRERSRVCACAESPEMRLRMAELHQRFIQITRGAGPDRCAHAQYRRSRS